MAIMLTMIALFFAGIIAILYITLKRSRSFDDYAVAGRSFGPWYVAMCYVNSWWPGTVFISFAGSVSRPAFSAFTDSPTRLWDLPSCTSSPHVHGDGANDTASSHNLICSAYVILPKK